MSHFALKYFTSVYSETELGSWIDLFATTYKVSDDADVKHRATTLLRDKFSMGAISICLQIYTDSMSGMEVKIYETHAIPVEEMAKCREIERLHFDTLVQTHPELAFMTSGCAGRIKYQIIPSLNEEHSHIQFNELERAPILDLNQRRFRQSFPLSADYQLQESTKLFGYSPKEELLLFLHRSNIQRNPLDAVVSLLNPHYRATAFRVCPTGGYITCFHNLFFQDGGVPQELWIHSNVISVSYDYARSQCIKVKHMTCELPALKNHQCDPMNKDIPLASTWFPHSDVAFVMSSTAPEGGTSFLIPCARDLDVDEPVLCMGYPGLLDSTLIRASYPDILQVQAPDLEEYQRLFHVGNLSVSPGPLRGINDSAKKKNAIYWRIV